MRQSDAELREHLQEQVGFILVSVEEFHRGKQAEAKRMATAIRVLVHDTDRSDSVLSQLGLKHRILYYDTGTTVTDPGIASAFSLAAMTMTITKDGPKTFWSPSLDPHDDLAGCTCRPFSSWWTRPVVKDNLGEFFCRRDFVLGLANKDGGAHVDPVLGDAYGQLTRHGSLGWRTDTEDGPQAISGLELACVRQVAHELLVSLACQAPDAFSSREGAEMYASRLFETDAADRMHVGGVRPPLNTLRRERLTARGVGRNAPCPCGSGQKFKHCHGL